MAIDTPSFGPNEDNVIKPEAKAPSIELSELERNQIDSRKMRRQSEAADRKREEPKVQSLAKQIDGIRRGTPERAADSNHTAVLDRKREVPETESAKPVIDAPNRKSRQSVGKLGAALISIGHVARALFQFVLRSKTLATENESTEQWPALSPDVERVILVLQRIEAGSRDKVPNVNISLDRIHQASRHMTDGQREELVRRINRRLVSAGLPWHAGNLNGKVGFYKHEKTSLTQRQ